MSVKFRDLLLEPIRNGIYKPKQFHGRGCKIVNMGELFAYPRLFDVPMRRVELSEREQETALLMEGDLLFARRSLVAEGAGKSCIVKKITEPTTFESSIIRARPDPAKASSDYLYYLFNSDLGRHLLGSILRQVAVSGITGSDLANLQLKVPPVATQQKIGELLSAFDERIELNLQINATLEAIAQAIFKQWFVDLQFPGFNGEFVDGLPKGWRFGKVRDVCDVNKNSLTSRDNFKELKYVEISEVSGGVINKIATYERGEEPSRARRKLSHGDVVLSTVRPDRGSYFLALNPEPNLIVSTGFAVFSPRTAPYAFLYLLLTHANRISYYGRLAEGAAYPAINPSIVMDMEIIVPAPEVLTAFHSVVEPLLLRVDENLRESTTISRIRDTLLPKLMSGQVAISE